MRPGSFDLIKGEASAFDWELNYPEGGWGLLLHTSLLHTGSSVSLLVAPLFPKGEAKRQAVARSSPRTPGAEGNCHVIDLGQSAEQ